MYRVVLRVQDVSVGIGREAAACITEGFKHRPWHQSAVCEYIDGGLTFTSTNDFDNDGLATSDELSDEICANVRDYATNTGNMSILRIEEF